jgi:hypothetical protein
MSAELPLDQGDHRRHLRLVTASTTAVSPVEDSTNRVTARELREMSRVAAHLRRRARRLPEDSMLREDLLETAEYYAAAAEDAAAMRVERA